MRDNEQPSADPCLLAALAKADLDELVSKLLGLARKKMWRSWKGLPPSGETPEDVVQKAFHQALSGVRKFPKENVDLYVFFVMVVRSLISHLAEKEENRCVHTPIEESGPVDGLEVHAARGGARSSRGCRARVPGLRGGQTDDGRAPRGQAFVLRIRLSPLGSGLRSLLSLEAPFSRALRTPMNAMVSRSRFHRGSQRLWPKPKIEVLTPSDLSFKK